MTDPSFRFGTSIEGVQFIFDFRWNARDNSWYMDLFTEDEVPIASGSKIVLGAMLGGIVGTHDPNFPAGAFFAADLSGNGQEAGLDDLGTRVPIYFVPASELAA